MAALEKVLPKMVQPANQKGWNPANIRCSMGTPGHEEGIELLLLITRHGHCNSEGAGKVWKNVMDSNKCFLYKL